ncbi:RimJ/RimL family protein N-acetyltransferase [Kribbella sp. VKM Ac-2527]|uniref:RimJ/RimL family protein N-acetyltransferase n=1 Tax=Kribbella caucasensis TaxID=2512215 RepID=A0A4R6JEF6_9ACTN|nr:GNAT family protein [Kribbella sp. VKM Ac-2527]TDO34229.1 RimJ/RimL family protein N-acetyltransferase [Kribbella sp. VKM Ac-2527]
MTTAPDGRPLIGEVVRLDRLVAADIDQLYAAIGNEQVYASGFGGGPAGLPRDADEMREQWVESSAKRVAYVVRLVADGKVVGTTSLGDVDLPNESVHLGWTGYAPAVWGTVVNPECKFLLLEHAFETCGFGRVKIQTGLENTRSQAAIAKLGATREGVLRRHKKLAGGTFRDTVVFSILADEWPAVRKGLLARISG